MSGLSASGEDDDDDEFFNDPNLLAHLDQLETQFTSTQQQQLGRSQSTHQPVSFEGPASKRRKTDHQIINHRVQRQDEPCDDHSIDYADGPGLFVDENGVYHDLKSPEPPVRMPQLVPAATRASARSTDTSFNPSKLSDLSNHRRPSRVFNPSNTSSKALGTIHTHSKSNLDAASTSLGSSRALSAGFDFQNQSRNNQPRPIDSVARVQAELEQVKESLKQANAEKNRLKGEVSIVRSSLDSLRAKTSKELHELKRSEQTTKLRAEEVEKELERMRNEKEVNEIFKGLQESAKRPLVRKNLITSTPLSPSKRLAPRMLFQSKASHLRNETGSTSLDFEPAQNFASSDDSPRSKKGPSTVNNLFHTPKKACPQDIDFPPSEDLVTRPDSPPATEPQTSQHPQPHAETELLHSVIVNMFQSFMFDMDPSKGNMNSAVYLQKVLNAEFDEISSKSRFDNLMRDLFNCLSLALSEDWNPNLGSEEYLMNFITSLGVTTLEITRSLVQTKMQEALPVSVAILHVLCQTTPLFSSLFLRHPDFDSDFDLIRLLEQLITKSVEPKEENGIESNEITLQNQLLHNVLDLMETLVWDPAEVCYPTLELLLKSEKIFGQLIDGNHPDNVQCQTLSILISLTCKTPLSNLVLMIPIQIRPQTNLSNRSSKRETPKPTIPLIERLLNLIISDHYQIQIQILRLISLLTVKVENGYILIGESTSMISALIRIISRDCITLWNGDGGIRHRIEIPLCVEKIDLAIDLIYKMIFDSSCNSNLMDRLQESSRQIPGIHHEFVVSFSKLAFSELPSFGYLNKEQLVRLDIISDLAYELLQSVASPDELQDWRLCSTDETPTPSEISNLSNQMIIDEGESGEIFM